ncbi:MAG: phosphate/phosphite/phosphonate ABC transporter substrate-binding protein [Nitrospirota bacterium]
MLKRLSYLEPLIRRIFFTGCIFLLLFSPGCSKKETPKKVSLYKRSGDVSEKKEGPSPNTLWFGFDLRLGPKEEVQIYTPFLKYLEDTTGKRFRIKFTEKYEETVENLGKGFTHFAALGTLSYVIGENKHGIRYLVSGVNKEGDPRYHSIIFTRPDSGIEHIKDIKGNCFAFGSEMSTQGHLIPRKMMEEAGVTLDDLKQHIYTGSHLNAVQAVLNRDCDAGAIQDIMANRLASEGKIKIIKISGSYPSSLIAFNKSLDTKTVEAVKSALLAFEPMGKHRGMLVDWDKTEMPLGFTVLNEFELKKVTDLAREYGLLKNETEN